MEEYMLICEDSMDGIMTAIYEAYQIKKEERIESHDQIHISVADRQGQLLFMHYVEIETDLIKSQKVAGTLQNKLGQETYYYLCMAMLSNGEDKADSVYHAIVTGLQYRDPKVLERLYLPYVQNTFSYARYANNELMHLRGFLRFAELEQGILYAKIAPKNNIISHLMEHFKDRLPSEDFVIYDENRKIFGLHPKQKQWYLVSDKEFDQNSIIYSEEEKEYRELFCHFCHSISIKERENPTLQMTMLPLRFRPNMVEFTDKISR